MGGAWRRCGEGLLSGVTAIGPVERFADRGFLTNMGGADPGPRYCRRRIAGHGDVDPAPGAAAGKLSPMTPVILATTVGEIEYVERRF